MAARDGRLAAADKTGSFYGGLELALAAMLVSPEFLYIVETAEPDPDHPGQLRMDNYSRAARLSYLLWNTTPNKALLDAAAAGRLTDPKQLHTIAANMVKSPRIEQGVRAFFSDMLLFEKFDELAKDSVVYPRFNQDVAKALPEQMTRTTPLRRITLHLSQIFLTLGRTFIVASRNLQVASRESQWPHQHDRWPHGRLRPRPPATTCELSGLGSGRAPRFEPPRGRPRSA